MSEKESRGSARPPMRSWWSDVPRLERPIVGDVERRSKLLSALLLLMLTWGILWPVVIHYYLLPQSGWSHPEVLLSGAFAASVLGIGLLNRGGHHASASILAVALLCAGVFASLHLTLSGAMEPVFSRNDAGLLTYLVVPVVLGAVLLPPRLLLALLAVCLGAVLAVPAAYPQVSFADVFYGPLLYLLVVCGLLLYVSYLLSAEQRRNLGALREREERYRSLFEQSPDPCLLVAPEGTIRAVNAAGLELFGYAADELIGRSVTVIYADPSERGPVIDKTERLGSLFDEPVRLRTKAGAIVDCLLTIRSRRDAAGTTVEYQTIVRDVTARMQAEEELRLRGQVLEVVRDAVILVEPGGQILFANRAAEELSGYAAGELVGMNLRQLNTSEGVVQWPTLINTLLREGHMEFEALGVRKDGSRIRVETYARRFESRGRTLLLTVSRDVTERRRSEAELRLRGELLDMANDAVILHDLRGALLYVNDAAALQRGYTREELMGLTLRALDDEETATRFGEHVSMLMNKRSVAFEGSHRRKDGTVFPVEVRSQMVESGDRSIVLSVVRDISERRQAEATLKAERDRAQGYLDVAAVMLVVMDVQGNIALLNRRGAEMLGAKEKDLIGRSWIDTCVPEEQRDYVRSVFADYMSGRADIHEYVVNDIVTLSGGRRTIAWHNALLRDAAGRPAGTLSSGEDITERLATERALKLSEERFRALYEQSIDAIFENAPDGSGMQANLAWMDLFGYTADDVAGMNVSDMYVNPADRESYVRTLLEMGSVRDEVWLRKKDGTPVLCQRVASTRRDASGQVVAFQGIVRDITALRKAEAGLRESEEKFRQLFEQSRDAIYLVRPDGTFIDVNQAWLDLLGCTRDDVSRYDAAHWYADPEGRKRYLERMATAGDVLDDEVQLRRKDGTVFDCQRRIVAQRDADGNLVAYQGVMRDVTEERRAEQALRESEAKYRDLFDKSMDAVALVSIDGTLLDANPAELQLYGDGPEVIGTTNVRGHYVSPGVRDEFLRILERDGVVVDQEVQVKKRDGTVMDVVRTAVARRDADGRMVSIQTVTRNITDRKRAERALLESEEKYRLLFERSLDAIYINTPEGKSIEANQAWLDMFGYSREELAGLHSVDMYADSKDRESFLRQIRQDGFVVGEARFKRKDGTQFDGQRSVVALRDEVGNVTHFVGIMRDITEDKRRKAALADELARRRILVEHSRDGIVVLDQDGRAVETNLRFAEMLGYSPEEILRLHVSDWDVPIPQERLKEMIKTVDESGDHFETRHRRKDGSIYDVEISTNAAVFDGRKLIFCVCRDISARKRAEQELRDSELRFRALVEHTGLGCTVTRTDGSFIEANEVFLRMTGYTREELLRLHVPDVYASLAERERVLAKGIRDGYVRGEELEFRRSDGSPLYVSLTSALVPLHGETVVISEFLDITQRRAVEEELRRSEGELRRLATRLEEAREEERTGIARELHDRLGQSLTALKFDLDSMRRAAVRGEPAPAEKLQRMLKLLDETTDDVRRISSELRPGILDDVGLVAAVEWELHQFGERTGIDCRLTAGADDAVLDRARSTVVFRVFQELLTNVARHAKARSVFVAFEKADGGFVLMVTDDGVGITPEQTDDVSSLGLIGIRERVRPFGGSVEISGAPGKGTTARVTLPVS